MSVDKKSDNVISDFERILFTGWRKLWDANTEQEVRDILVDIETQTGKPMSFMDKAATLLQSLSGLQLERMGEQWITQPEAESDLISVFLQAKGAQNEII